MKYDQLATKIRTGRKASGISQAALATQLGVGQQVVSRWEKATYRPDIPHLHLLASLFGGEVDEWLKLARYSDPSLPPDASVMPGTIRSRPESLPYASLTPENFELFCRDLIKLLNRGAEVHRLGTKGNNQYGIDIYASEAGKLTATYQCKRHKQFGKEMVKQTIEKATRTAKQNTILLTRQATTDARDEVSLHKNWSLWDSEDISRIIRFDLEQTDARKLIDTYFPGGWIKDFLGLESTAAWLSPADFFRPLQNRLRLFSHGWSFVGRSKKRKQLTQFLESKDRIKVISGIGGVGKSRLLKSWSDEICEKSLSHKVLFASPSTVILPSHFEELPMENLIVVIDDAHERTDLDVIINGITGYRPQSKIVISTRPYGLSKIYDIATKAGLPCGKDEVISLGDLSKEDARSLSTEILNLAGANTQYANRIAEITKDCPLFTVVGSKLVGDGLIAPDVLNNSEDFRRELLRLFRNVVTGEIGAATATQNTQELLSLIATVQPIDPTKEDFQHAIEAVLKTPFYKTSKQLRALEESGILLRRGASLRIAPDLLADYIRAEAAYDEKSQVPTKYIDSVFSQVGDELSINLLVNLSQLDWRLSLAGMQAKLLDGVWSEVSEEFKRSDYAGQRRLLKSIENIAYYQPDKAIDLVKIAMNSTADRPMDIDTLTPLLRYAAYTFEYLDDSLNLLHTLAKQDHREIKNNQDHPVAILANLAKIEPNKPVEFTNKIIDEVSKWANEEDALYPFDVLDSALATEGYQTETSGYTLSMIPFRIIPEAIKQSRDKTLDLCFEIVSNGSLQKGLRAVKSLQEALRYPMGLVGRSVSKEEEQAWEPSIIDILSRFESLAKAGKLHPMLTFEIREAVSWHANFGRTHIKPKAEAVLAALPKDDATELTRALLDGWGFTFERGDDGRKDEEAWHKWQKELATKLTLDYDSKQLINLLEKTLDDISNHKISTDNRQATPGPFIASIINQDPELGIDLADFAIDKPDSQLASWFSIPLLSIGEKDPLEAISLANRGLKTGNTVIMRGIAHAYSWGFRDTIPSEQEMVLFNVLANSSDEAIRHNITRASTRIALLGKRVAVDFLLSIKFEDSKYIADELLGEFSEHGSLPIEILSKADTSKILNQLEKMQDLDSYQVQDFMSAISGREPLLLVEMIMRRVEASTGHRGKEDFRYHPVPHRDRSHSRWQVRNSESFKEVMLTLRDWMSKEPRDWFKIHYGGEIFALIVGRYDEGLLTELEEWAFSPLEEQIEIVASILGEAPHNFVFKNSDFAIKFLSHASSVSDNCYKTASSALFGATISASKTGIPGEPFAEDIALRDDSDEVIKNLPKDSPAYKFYKNLYNHASEMISRDSNESIDD